MSTLHLDITSRSKVFNSLLPQGNSYFHKFGKRPYPLSDLNLSKVSSLHLSLYNKIFCNSFFGDSLTHPKITSLASRCHTFEKELLVFTQGSTVDKVVLEHLKNKNVTIYLNLYGAFDTANLVTQNLDWDYIKSLIEFYQNKLIIEYHIFKQNISSIEPLINLCLENNVTLNFKKDNFGNGPVNIFNEFGEWLYDLNSIDSNYDILGKFLANNELLDIKKKFKKENFKLQKSIQGYSNLKFYLHNKSDKNILNIEVDDLITEDIDMPQEEDMYINFLGYVFKNKLLFETFNQCICNDWAKDLKKYINCINTFGYDNSKEILETIENEVRFKYRYGSEILFLNAPLWQFHHTSGLKLEFLKVMPYINYLLKNIKENNLTKLS